MTGNGDGARRPNGTPSNDLLRLYGQAHGKAPGDRAGQIIRIATVPEAGARRRRNGAVNIVKSATALGSTTERRLPDSLIPSTTRIDQIRVSSGPSMSEMPFC
jgi:hypothetical protein